MLVGLMAAKKKPKGHDADGRRLIAENRKARHRYLLLDELECGIALVGTEVKSLRAGQCSLVEAWARIERGELWLMGAHIGEYRFGNVHNHEPLRPRKLLAHRREIEKWAKQVREKGVTLVPLEIYFKDARVKLKLALARGKQLHDKRQSERDKADKRQIERALGRHR